MHPADLADIVEDLSPDDREAIFETIDSEVAAEALSEVEPDIQASILESLETEKAADIVEEMAPHEAADVLAELEEQTSEDILEEMEPEPKTEVEELLEFARELGGRIDEHRIRRAAGKRDRGGRDGGAEGARGDSGDAEYVVPGGSENERLTAVRSAGAAVHRRGRDAAQGPGRRTAAPGGRRGKAGPHHRDFRQVQSAGACRWWTKRASWPAQSRRTKSFRC